MAHVIYLTHSYPESPESFTLSKVLRGDTDFVRKKVICFKLFLTE